MGPKDLFLKCLPSRGRQKGHAGVPPGSLRKLGHAIEALEVGKNFSDDIVKQLEELISMIQFLSATTATYALIEEPIDAVEHILSEDLPLKLAGKLEVLDFEARTVAVNFCCVLLQLGLPYGLDREVLEYVCKSKRLFDVLLEGCAVEEVSTHAGIILRSCLRHEVAAKVFVEKSHVFRVLDLVQNNGFAISTDSFETLREVFLMHKEASVEWLFANSSDFFRRYNEMLQGGDYVVQRQALKLLSELLLDRSARDLMLAYVGDERNLCIHMNLLRDSSKILQFEAFHVFKLFAANPHKPIRVQKILSKNQSGLIQVIDSLQPTSSSGDDQFLKDKKCIIEKLQALPCLVPALAPVEAKAKRSNVACASPGYAASNASASTADTDGCASFYESL